MNASDIVLAFYKLILENNGFGQATSRLVKLDTPLTLDLTATI
jgi:hypothetical protein